MADHCTAGAAAPIPSAALAAFLNTSKTPGRDSEVRRHYCSRCGHSGGYAGTGPHTCPGCDRTLSPVPSGVAPTLPVDPVAFPNTSTTTANPPDGLLLNWCRWQAAGLESSHPRRVVIAATLADHPPPARTLPTWPAKACADRVRYELHPVLAGLSLLTNSVRVLRAVDAYAVLSGSFADALKDACPDLADPFAHGGEASAEAVVSDLARYAADLCAEILVMNMNGGAA